MSYQRGALRKLHRKAGETWVLRYRVTSADGKRVENNVNVGLVRDFPKEKDAWREVDRLVVTAQGKLCESGNVLQVGAWNLNLDASIVDASRGSYGSHLHA